MSLKRIVLTSLLLLAVIALALPWWIGRDAEARYRAMVSSSTESAMPFRLRLEAFDRGWLTSRARVSVQPVTAAARRLVALAAPAGADALVLEDRIAHGLLPLPGDGPGPGWRPALAVIHGELRAPDAPGGEPVARIGYRVGLAGGLSMTVTAPGGGGGDFGWRGLRLGADVPAGTGPAVLQVAAERLAVPHALGRLVMTDVAGRIDLDLPADGLPSGTAELKAAAAHLEAVDGDRQVGSATGLSLQAALDGGEEVTRFNLHGQLARLGSPRETYGPGELDLSLTGLDTSALRRLAASAARLQGQGLTGRARTAAVAGALLAETPSLLARGPVLSLDRAELATADGPLTAQGRLALETTERVVLNNPYLLQRAVAGHFQLRVPPVAARHAALIHLRRNGLLGQWGTPAAWLDAQVARGRLARDDGDYRLTLRLADARLTLNGRPWAQVAR